MNNEQELLKLLLPEYLIEYFDIIKFEKKENQLLCIDFPPERKAPKRYLPFPYSKTELFLAANEEIFTILDNQMVKN